MSTVSSLCIAGKNQVAVDILDRVAGMPSLKPFVLPVADDDGRHDWQPSLKDRAKELDVPIVTIDWVMNEPNLTFLSLEFDRLIVPSRFASQRLYNIHFSLLPKFRGCYTSIWPILNGEKRHGVTLHRIDAGMDTGPIIDQRSFAIEGMTARQLYFRSMAEGRDLVLKWLCRMIAGDAPFLVQDEEQASTYRRADLDFSLSKIEPSLTVDQALARIRAFNFPEYQIATYAGHGIIDVRQSNLPNVAPGTVIPKSPRTVTIGFADGQLTLDFDRDWMPSLTTC